MTEISTLPVLPPSLEYTLVEVNDPILKQEAFAFEFTNFETTKRLSTILIKAAMENNALGLAAPQIGVPQRVFVIKIKDEYVPIFNPKIVYSSEDTSKQVEGCVSLPNFYVSVERSRRIRVRYQNLASQVVTSAFDDDLARVFQHEYDHLQGILISDRVSRLKRDLATKRKIKLDKMKATTYIKG